MNWFVYIAKCSDDTFYTGVCKDPRRRAREHQNGRGAKYTRSRRPISLRTIYSFDSRGEAQAMEAMVKKLSHDHKQELWDKHPNTQNVKQEP